MATTPTIELPSRRRCTAGTPQFINFLKNLAIIGGLLSLASIYGRRLPNNG